MPIMNGHEFAKAYQDTWRNSQRSVVIMTYSSSESNEDREKMSNYPFVKDYIIKGAFDSLELQQKIESHLSK